MDRLVSSLSNVADGTRWNGSCSGEVMTMLRPLGRLICSSCFRDSAYISFNVNKCVRSDSISEEEDDRDREDRERSESVVGLASPS